MHKCKPIDANIKVEEVLDWTLEMLEYVNIKCRCVKSRVDKSNLILQAGLSLIRVVERKYVPRSVGLWNSLPQKDLAYD